jgi:16S rRNA (uracil1498-N3)-methyltransferase
MQLFYTTDINGNGAVLSDEESWHCTKVLRMTEGDPVMLTDGLGNLYEGRMAKVHHKGCLVEIVKITPEYGKRDWNLHIAIAPTKSIDRLEWFLEKATEIGIHTITPIICDHSEREVVKIPRLEKILISAMKQSLKAYLPELREPRKFRELVTEDHPGQRFIAYCLTGFEASLSKNYTPGSDVTILVGPEGDFSPSEVELAKESGFLPVSLGPSRLRTETAGIAACHTINLLNEIVNQFHESV